MACAFNNFTALRHSLHSSHVARWNLMCSGFPRRLFPENRSLAAEVCGHVHVETAVRRSVERLSAVRFVMTK